MTIDNCMEQKVCRYIQSNQLLSAGDDVTVALSGGADSVALLWVLWALAPRLGICLRAAHFHHGLRGAEADRDAEFCRQLCAAWEIPFTLGRGDVKARAAETGESLEEAARVLRYGFLEQTAPGLIATAHNADDNAETLLLHLIRGTGPRGLGGIPPRRGRLIRPLLACSRAEIEALLDREGLAHVEDSSNGADDCLRNRLRHRVLPLLRQENPSLAQSLGRTMALVRQEDAFLSALAAEAERGARSGDGWSCRALLALDPVPRRRVLLGILGSLGLEDPAQVHVEALEALLETGPSARLALPGGLEARREYDLLLAGPPAKAPAPLSELTLELSGVTALPEGLGEIRCFVTKNLNFSQKKPTTFALKCDMIAPPEYKVRGRRPGDRLRLSGGSKALKDLMIDRKLPARLRDSIPVITLEDRPVAVFGVGAAPAQLAGPGECAVIVRWETPDPNYIQ